MFKNWVTFAMLSDMPGKNRLLFFRVTKSGITTPKKGGQGSFVSYR